MKNSPLATYRLQLNGAFPLTALKTILPYLAALGISTIYAAPILAAAKGSNHGYDGIDPERISPEVGTLETLKEAATMLQQLGMNWLQDIVPNHMAFDMDNTRLFDIVERGLDSPFAKYFDIRWEHPHPMLRGKLMAPFLARSREEILHAREIRFVWRPEGLFIEYGDRHWPLSVHSYRWLLSVGEGHCRSIQEALDAMLVETKSTMARWLGVKHSFFRQVTEQDNAVAYLTGCVRAINDDQLLMGRLLDCQHIALLPYAMADEHINYRRFFSVNSLICLNMESPEVFEDCHRFIFSLIESGIIQGLRVDHIDGLYEPGRYLSRLRERTGPDTFIVVEKILQPGENLPSAWPVQGSTGYDFLEMVNQLLTNGAGFQALKDYYASFTHPADYPLLVVDCKLQYMDRYMRGEVENLADLLNQSGWTVDGQFDSGRLREAIMVLIASFPVYRVYGPPFSSSSEETIRKSFVIARSNGKDLVAELSLLQSIFFVPADHPRFSGAARFIKTLMQVSGPIAAKGVEDTLFYRDQALVSRNEVGDSPGSALMNADAFHAAMQHRAAAMPFSLNTTATHDSKRGEDSRLRLNTLTIYTQEWIALTGYWRLKNSSMAATRGSRRAPSLGDEYFIYQSLLGGIELSGCPNAGFMRRFHEYFTKALREADRETSHRAPDEWYERSCLAFISGLLDPQGSFMRSFVPFAKKIIRHAGIFSLAQVMIKICAPGVCDFYQGSELWDLHFVDPDNRGAVNFSLRSTLLGDMRQLEKTNRVALANFLENHWDQGAPKLFVTQKTLAVKKRYPGVFITGDYLPISFANRDDIFCFLRRIGPEAVAVVAPLPRQGDDIETKAPVIVPRSLQGHWVNELTGKEFSLAESQRAEDLFEHFPVALLIKK